MDRYYVRTYAWGKEKWHSLKTTVVPVTTMGRRAGLHPIAGSNALWGYTAWIHMMPLQLAARSVFRTAKV
jgi:hypothetical protein